VKISRSIIEMLIDVAPIALSQPSLYPLMDTEVTNLVHLMLSSSTYTKSCTKQMSPRPRTVCCQTHLNHVSPSTDHLAKILDAHDDGVSILSVGSGDGSQQAAIVKRGHANITATFYDSKETLMIKYPSAYQHLETLKQASHSVLFSIDARKLETYPALGKYDIVMFPFPHNGVSNQSPANVSSNRELIRGFLHSVMLVLKPSGDAEITLKTGFPYVHWDIEHLLENDQTVNPSFDLVLSSKHELDKSIFPGYVHRRTIGAGSKNQRSVKDRGAQVYVFKHHSELL
jgi:hypothetical protein